jgi:HEPN domain-containing protein
MSGPPDEGRLVRAWAEKADHDLEAAGLILNGGGDAPFDAASFHAQQDAEKYLKALLTHLKVDFPYTHDLRVLLQRVGSRLKLDIDEASVIALNRYAIQTRYPGDPEPVDRQEAVEAIATARRVRAAVRAAIGELLTD